MKIVIIGTIYPYRGGLAAFNERLGLQLQEEGHQVKVHNFKLQYPDLLFPGKTQYDPEERKLNLETERSVNSINPINWFKTAQRIRDEKPDLVIVRYWIPFIGASLGFMLRKIKIQHRPKIIAITDNVIPHEKRIGDQMLTNYFLKSPDAFLAMSKSVEQDLATFSVKKPVTFSPHPVYDHFGDSVDIKTSLDHLELDSKFKYVLFFGLIRDYKGLDLLLKAFRKVVDKTKNLKLLIAGEVYSNEKVYHDLISELDLTAHVIFRNEFIPDTEVKYYFGASSLVAQPYKTATQSGITQIAYHFDKPMLVTDVGGLKEICPDGVVGFVAEVNSTSIAKKIVMFFSNTEIQNRMIQNIKKEKNKFSWEHFSSQIIQLSDQIA